MGRGHPGRSSWMPDFATAASVTGYAPVVYTGFTVVCMPSVMTGFRFRGDGSPRLACGAGAVLSHGSAAALWDLRRSSAAYIDVTVPSQNGRKRPGIRIHRSSRLRPEEVTVRDGIPVTTVARTVLDMADVLEGQALKRLIAEAEYTRQFDRPSPNAVVEGNPGRRGARVMAAIDGDWTRSQLEDAVLAFLEDWGVEKPRVNCWIAGYEADFVWPQAGLGGGAGWAPGPWHSRCRQAGSPKGSGAVAGRLSVHEVDRR